MQPTTTRAFFPTLTLALMLPALTALTGFTTPAHAAVAAVETETPTVTLAEATTRFRTRGRRYRNRARNVELAAKVLDGALLEPGAILSFNATVGERSAERGFVAAPVIANGRIRMGQGGGVCQVSTTLHLAALEAGLEIVEHRTHSRPSSYAPAGLDATVAWGRIDYRVRNPHPFAVRVHTAIEGGRITVSLEGAEEVDFAVQAELVRELPIAEQVIVDPDLAPGERVVEDDGRAGQVVRVIRTDAEGQREVQRLRYRSAPRIVRVGAQPPAPTLSPA